MQRRRLSVEILIKDVAPPRGTTAAPDSPAGNVPPPPSRIVCVRPDRSSAAPRNVRKPAVRGSGARASRTGDRVVLAIGVAASVAITAFGLPYYLAPIGERVRDPLHAWLKPSGTIGQAAGIVTFAMFVFMWLYPLRKRFPRLAFTGPLARWLDVHIVCGLLIPLVGAIHAGWRFQGLIGLGYLAMLLVSLSGIVGKYLYTRIPRSRSGVELSLEEAESRRRELLEHIAATTGLEAGVVERTLAPAGGDGRGGLGRVLVDLAAGDLARFRAVRRLRRGLRRAAPGGVRLDAAALREVVKSARREMALAQQLRMLSATHRVFRFWHVAHRPFAISAFVAVTIHVVVVVSLGVTWLW